MTVRTGIALVILMMPLSAVRLDFVLGAHVIVASLVAMQLFRFPRLSRRLLIPLWFLAMKLLSDALTSGVTLEEAKTYAFFLLTLVFFSSIHVLSGRNVVTRDHVALFVLIHALHASFLVAQYLLFNIAHDFSTLNPFGPFSQFGPDPFSTTGRSPYNPFALSIGVQILRPNGLNWEPSAAAMWCNGALTVTLIHFRDLRLPRLTLLILVSAVVCTGSLVGIIHVAVLLSFLPLLVTRQTHRKGLVAALAFVILILVVTTIPLVFESRIDEITRPGTSGFFRVTAPLNFIQQQGASLLGPLPIGSNAFELWLQRLAPGGRSELATIDNTFFQIYLYFGIVGLGTLATILGAHLSAKHFGPSSLILTVSVLCCFLYGGHLFNPIVVLTVGLVILLSAQTSQRSTIEKLPT